MKELDPLHQDNTRDEKKVHLQKSKGAWHIPTGLKVWQVNPETEKPEEVKATTVKEMDKVLGETRSGATASIKQTALKVEMNKHFFYCKAINAKNALRKYLKSQFYVANKHRKQTSGHPPHP